MYKKIFKRFFDILFSLLILPIFLLISIIVAIMIKFNDRGPIFYNSDRIGKNGKIFKMYKYRTMVVNAPDIRYEDGSTYNSKDDTRVTKVGKLLRKTSIDEIPQILNIIKGDMSFIGPRPDTPMDLDYYSEDEQIIFEVRPGISGYNQVINRNSVGSKEKLKNDIVYVNRISFMFDTQILFMTIKNVFLAKNVYRDASKSENIDIR